MLIVCEVGTHLVVFRWRRVVVRSGVGVGLVAVGHAAGVRHRELRRVERGAGRALRGGLALGAQRALRPDLALRRRLTLRPASQLRSRDLPGLLRSRRSDSQTVTYKSNLNSYNNHVIIF